MSLSIAAFAANRLRPVLGLDLQGGVSVILSAPEGTDADTMNTALENIRNRVDAFGVGEPDIALSGTTIEIQIPGLSDSTVEERTADLECIADAKGATYGCSSDVQTPTTALKGFDVASQVAKVCVVARDAELSCFQTQAAADAAKTGITTEPKASASASASASSSASASPTPSEGPGSTAGEYCLTDFVGAELQCYPDYKTAQAAYKSLDTKVTETTWCITAPQPKTPEPSATPTPGASPKKSASPSPSASASAANDPGTAYAELDQTGSSPLPCDAKTKQEAEQSLEALAVQHITTRYCVVSSQGQDLGCYTTQSAAAERQRETGQQHLLELIGQTARLEERPTIEIVSPGDPRFQSIQLTCQTDVERASKACTDNAQDANEVWYPDEQGDAVHLGPVTITGGNITNARAALSGGSQSVAEWLVNFELDGDGTQKFADATRLAVTQPPPQNQIAIAVDRKIISNPVVQGAITAGSGQISGNFTEQSAKDLAAILNAGSLPVNLTQESVQTVSPTLGSESLDQGIVAGAAGLFLLFMYLLFYYRMLGVVAWFGMAIWAILAVTLISLAGRSFGYALTLAGVAGLVISLGVTADSYIVFFERLKDEVRAGRSPRTAVQPAFQRAFKTIVAADVVTGIAAAVLYFTAVSSVRGFALTLGVATALDLFVVYFFKRPTVFLIARSSKLSKMKGFGLASATGADHMQAPEGPA
jgi:preprotein translocase subunit SecD